MCDEIVIYSWKYWNQQPYMKTIMHCSIEIMI